MLAADISTMPHAQHDAPLAVACTVLTFFVLCSQWEGIYVLYTYAAKRTTAKAVQQLLSNPDVGSEDTILRFMTMRKSGGR
jgi:hypothetical protein